MAKKHPIQPPSGFTQQTQIFKGPEEYCSVTKGLSYPLALWT